MEASGKGDFNYYYYYYCTEFYNWPLFYSIYVASFIDASFTSLSSSSSYFIN